MSEQGSKTEQPTEKRLNEAFDEGNFAKSPDIQAVFVLMAAFGVVVFAGHEQTRRIASIAVGIFSGLARYQIDANAIREWTATSIWTLLAFVLPFSVTCAVAGVLAGGLQSGFRLSPKAMELKLTRLNPLSGFQRIFSAQGIVKLITDAVKLIVVGAILWSAVKGILSDPIFYTPVAPTKLGLFIEESFTKLLGRCIFALGAVAAVHYIYQRRKILKDLMMTKQEVKDEMKQAEGDPVVRSARRQMARRMLQKQMLSAVPTADVVVTNPTHFAVALKYERGTDKAPMVLAKGERLFAQRIKAIAAENGVPMVENKPVARMLFKYGKVGKPIPLELYQAVAEILAFVYKTHRYYFHQLRARRASL